MILCRFGRNSNILAGGADTRRIVIWVYQYKYGEIYGTGSAVNIFDKLGRLVRWPRRCETLQLTLPVS